MNNNRLTLNMRIKEEKVLSILSQDTKETILENVIDSTTIEDLKKSTMQVKIDIKGHTINQRVDDYNLLSWFELKKIKIMKNSLKFKWVL